MICLQNRVREMLDAKLTEALQDADSLREDMKDVTDQHNKKMMEMREEFDKEKKDETEAIIASHEAAMAEFEAKIRKESSDL